MADWLNDDGEGDTLIYGDDHVEMGIGNAAFAAWDVWRRGSWPFANWLTVPLSLLVRMSAIDFTYNTKKYMTTEGADWSKLTKAQMELVTWLSE